MTVTLPQLRALAAVVDHGSFTAAAEKLGVSQSSVSHTLKSWEKAIGAPLLDRDRGNRPTRLASELLPHARSALAALEALQGSIDAGSGKVRGCVRLGAVATACQGLVPGLMGLWKARLPEVEVSIFEGDDDELPDWLESGMVDAAILIDPASTPPGSRVVAVDEMRAIVRRDHPLADEPSMPIDELLQDGLIAGQGGCEGQLRRIHALAGLPFETSQRVRELATIMSMVQEGIGVAIIPSLGEGMLPASLCMRPLVPTVERTLVLSGPASRPWNPLVGELIAALPEQEPMRRTT
ncbi:LysR family transcriptional regulator [Zafaria sp. Z1313]|uniref:LysR family transcriptional regulator n=1 Tax=Zafaria sp. Z1313 TaxID=3423202 RepID=UPI003D301B34